jgi:hypothetical protein
MRAGARMGWWSSTGAYDEVWERHEMKSHVYCVEYKQKEEGAGRTSKSVERAKDSCMHR